MQGKGVRDRFNTNTANKTGLKKAAKKIHEIIYTIWCKVTTSRMEGANNFSAARKRTYVNNIYRGIPYSP